VKAIVIRSGNMLYVAEDIDRPLPHEVHEQLIRRMQYDYVKRLYGKEAYGLTPQQRIRRERRVAYGFDGHGCLCCPAGYRDHVMRTLQSSGYEVLYFDDSARFPQQSVWDWRQLEGRFTYRPLQEETLKILEAAFRERRGGVIEAAAGFGKSELFAAIALMLPGIPILICVKSRDNVEKTVATLLNYLPRGSVGQQGAGRKRKGRVTVTTAASLKNCGNHWDLFLGDEAHELLADGYVDALIAATPDAIRFAFTATPKGRSDNADARMQIVFGETLFRLPYQEAVEHGLVVPIEVRWKQVEMDHNPCEGYDSDTSRQRHGLWRNRVRNRIIADTLLEHFESGEQSLVLVSKIEHALYLKKMLPQFTLCYGNMTEEDEKFYAGQKLLPADHAPMTVNLRNQLRTDFMSGKIRGAIATGVWKAGVSFNGLSALFWAAAGSSPIDATQGPSRVSRINNDGKDIGIVYDLVDSWDDQFYGQSEARRKIYRKHAWTQVVPEGAFGGPGYGKLF
jgi:superfamily II DNA or RNA helicase